MKTTCAERRKKLETLLIWFFAGTVLLALSLYGEAHVAFLAEPAVTSVQRPEEAFAAWKRGGLRGRTLVILDRHLAIDPAAQDAASFRKEEFQDDTASEALCMAVYGDFYATLPRPSKCGIETLNELLSDVDFYRRWKNKALPVVLSPEAEGLIAFQRGFSGRLIGERIPKTRRLNRLLLEAAYPGRCPSSERFMVGSHNFVYEAARGGIVRRVYHVVPDASWTQVAATLRKYSLVSFSNGTFRMAIKEGVPVVILRLRDLPRIREKVLLYVNAEFWDESAMNSAFGTLAKSGQRSDLISIYGTPSILTTDAARLLL